MKIDLPQKSVFYDFGIQKINNVINVKEKAANNDYCKENNTVAYTIDNNLYIADSKGQNIQITHGIAALYSQYFG